MDRENLLEATFTILSSHCFDLVLPLWWALGASDSNWLRQLVGCLRQRFGSEEAAIDSPAEAFPTG